MDFELGLKITRAEDEVASTDLCIAKDRAGPVFVSSETESMFILTAHLKGFKKEDVKISINEDGTQITVSGDKSVREIVMKGWKLHKKEGHKKGFRKIFNIPSGVDLDRIKARFAEDKSNLRIYMPKSETGGICGDQIEELKDDEKKVGKVREAGTSSADNTKKGHKEDEPLKTSDTKDQIENLQADQPIQQRDVEETTPSEKSPASSDPEKEEGADTKPQGSTEITSGTPPKLQLERKKFDGETSQPEQSLKQQQNQAEEDHRPSMPPREQETKGSQQPVTREKDNGEDMVEKGTRDGTQEALTSQAEISKNKDAYPPPVDNHEAEIPESNVDADKPEHLFPPGILLGSALLASVVVFVVGFIRSKKE